MEIFFISEIPLIIFLLLALAVIGLLGSVLSDFIVILAFIITATNIVVSLKFFLETFIGEILISNIRRILLGIFIVFFPITLFAFLLISGKYLMFERSADIYQDPKGFFVASLIGCVINLCLMAISALSDYFEDHKKRVLLIITNCLIILLILWLPYISQHKAIENRITHCQKQESQKCSIQEDDNIFVAFNINWKSNSSKDRIELKFWNYKVKQGELLYTTNNSYSKKSVKYVEVYNDSIWGYIREDNIIKEE